MPSFVVSTAFGVKDKGILGMFSKLSARADKFGIRSNKAFKTASKSALGFKSVLGGILSASVLTRGLGQLRMGLSALTTEFIDFDQAITGAAAKLDVKRGTAQFKELEKAARDVGATTEFTATQSAIAIDELVKAGFDQAQAMKAVRGTTNLATIANIDLKQSASIAVGALNAFGLAVNDPVKRLANLTKVNDIFSRTVNSSATDIEALNETMIQSGPVFKAVGSDFKTFATLAGAVARANLKGSLAGTTLKSTLLGLVSIAPKAAKVFKKLDIETMTLAGDMKDPIQLMSELSDKTKNMGTGMRGAALDTIFGRRAISGVSKVLALGGDWLRKYRKDTISTGRTAKQVADDMRKSIGNRLAVIKSTAIEVGFKFIDAFKNKLPGAIDFALAALRKIDVKAIIDDVRGFVHFLWNVKETVKDLMPLIKLYFAAWAAHAIIMKGIALAGVIGSFVQMAAAVNPVTIAIGLLIVAGIMLYDAWDDIVWLFQEIGRVAVESFNDIWQTVKPFVDKVWKEFSRLLDNPFFVALGTIFLPFITVPGLIIKHWKPIKSFFSNLWESIKAGYKVVIEPILSAIGIIDPVEIAASVKPQSALPGSPQSPGQTPGGSEAGFRAPNASIEEARRQQSLEVSGKMTFENPPPGAKFESEFFDAPPIPEESLGFNQ